MSGNLITPTGVLVPNAGEPHTPEWYAARRLGVTATDLPKILGLSSYGNALSVWNDKFATGNDEPSEEAWFGLEQEDIVARRWALKNGDPELMPVGTLAHIGSTWMMASLDRLVLDCPDDGGLCGLEIKTRNAFVAGKWREEVPDDVLAQVTWQLMVSGLDHIHVACLLGGQRMQQYTVARDNQLEDYLMAAAEPIWACIKTHTPPEVEADAGGVLLAELNKMFADRTGVAVIDPEEADRLKSAYLKGGDAESTGKSIKAIAKTEMVKLMGGAEVAVSKDNELEVLWTYKRPPVSQEMTTPNLKRLKRDHPRVYARLVADGYITPTTNNPRINVK